MLDHKHNEDGLPSWEPEEQNELDRLASAWLEGQTDEVDRYVYPAITVTELLSALADAPETLTRAHLRLFSDLSAANAEQVRQRWPSIPVERRRDVVRYLVEQAETDLSLLLGRLLRIVLDDPDPFTRRIAIDGLLLGEEIEAQLVGPLVQLLLNDRDNGVRAAAAAALGSVVLAGELDELDAALAMRAEDALFSVLLRADEPLTVRCAALESLAYSGEVGVRQLIEDAYYAPEEEMRLSALSAMGHSADIRWRGLARVELQNPSWQMRAAAAQACGELEAKSALDDLIALVADDAAEVRQAAIFALGRIGGRAAREALGAVSAGDDADDAAAAEEALEEMLFYADADGIPLFDETEAEEDDFWDFGRDPDDDDLGVYQDDEE